MHLTQASGALTYSPEISGIIEGIASVESRIARRSKQERDDIKQEIRMACIKALSQYDHTRIGPSPYAYLQRCARNHLYNLSRGTLVPNNPPCVRCPLWDKVKKICTVDEVGCTKIVDYRKNMEAKSSIKHADNLGDYESVDNATASTSEVFDLYDTLKSSIPEEMIKDFEKMARGASHEVSAKRRSQIRKIVRGVISDGET